MATLELILYCTIGFGLILFPILGIAFGLIWFIKFMVKDVIKWGDKDGK